MEVLGQPSAPISSFQWDTVTPEQSLATNPSIPLTARITSPDPILSWITDEELYDEPLPKTIEDIAMPEDPYHFDESDEDEGNGKSYYVGDLGWGDTVDNDIAEAAGFDSGFVNERQVFLDSNQNIYSHTEKSAFLAGNATEQELFIISNSLNKYNVHASSCEKCKENKMSNEDCHWIMDSGASRHFTPMLSDFADFSPYDGPILSTAAKSTPLQIKGEGTVFLSHLVKNKKGYKKEVITRFHPVYHVPGMSIRLMSLGELLLNGCDVQGNEKALYFLKENRRFPSLSVEPHAPRQTIFWLHGRITDQRALVTNIIDSGDYDLWHQRLGHPSKRVLYEAQKHVKDFPKGIVFPNKESLCRGCAEGKMHSRSFPDSQSRATKAFQRIHSDLKSFAVESYHRYRYLISYIDDYTSNAWVILLRNKDDALNATKNFVAAVDTQHKTKIQEWMSDAGGEYKSHEFDDFLKSKGIKILQSVPHQPEQNGRAERFNRTIMDKAQSLRFTACLPQMWWEFSILHAVHLYNRTPVQRLNWKTPYELLHGEEPSYKHLRVFGCAAHVFLPEDVRVNKLSPKSELMIFLGYKEGVKGFLFMRLPNNVLFTGATALFDEKLFPKCPEGKLRGFIPVGEDPSEDPTEVPISLDDGDDGPTWPAPNPPIPRREENHDRDGDNEIPPPDDDEPREQPPRRSGRTRVIPSRPDNVYGDRTPTEIIRDVERQTYWRKTVEGSSSSQKQPPVRLPQPKDNPNKQRDIDAPLDDDEATLLKLQKEGGVRFILYLVNKAIPRHNNDLPSELNVQNWTFRDILRLPAGEQKKWKDACHEELESLQKRNVYELVKLPPGRKAIKNRWVFAIKSDGRKRARLVAKGFSQVEGLEYDEIFSPVVRFESVRLLFALAALENWHMTALDVKTAFLYGQLDEEIYMEQPEGFKVKGQEFKVLRLRRAIYGLKQASLAWWKELDKSVRKLGFKRLYADAGIFVSRHKDGTILIMLAYVDDILFMGPNLRLLKDKKALFMEQWECRDLGECKEFLQIQVMRKDGNIIINQIPYLQKVIQRFGMTNAKHTRTPLPQGYKPLPNENPVDPILRQKFQSVIGSLLYIMLGTRPDIAYAVTVMSQFAVNPSQEHLDKALYICRYLAGTEKYALVYEGLTNKGLIAYTDSDWAADPVRRRSVTGFFFKLANGIISWQSRSQKTVALSSTEAEYMALSDCSRQAVWIKSIFDELGMPIGTVPIAGDNQGSIFISSNPVQERRSKHIDIRYHYVRDCIEEKKVAIFFVDGVSNPADLFTKNLGETKFVEFRKQLGLVFT
jgi:transposase InsO family protein